MSSPRDAQDSDSDGVIALIGGVFAEYPGVILDVEREEPELLTPASSFDRFWVVEDDGVIVACIACSLHPEFAELKKLYVDRRARGRGLGRQLIELVESTARDHGARGIELWSDTRFETAHTVYERLGYARGTKTRALHDLSNTIEYYYSKRL